MPNEGSLLLVVLLIVLQGVTGISFGLVISSAIDDEQSANQAALGIFYPNLILSGRRGFIPALCQAAVAIVIVQKKTCPQHSILSPLFATSC